MNVSKREIANYFNPVTKGLTFGQIVQALMSKDMSTMASRLGFGDDTQALAVALADAETQAKAHKKNPHLNGTEFMKFMIAKADAATKLPEPSRVEKGTVVQIVKNSRINVEDGFVVLA